jgi:hypothetical protein
MVAALFVFLAVVVSAQPVRAAGTDGWAVEPSGANGTGSRDFFVYQLKPGQSLKDTVGVSNYSDKPLTFKIYARDAFSTPGDASFGLGAEGDTPSDVGSWITLPADVAQYTVQPGTRADIPFIITVPPDATPGDHAGGIIAALVSSTEQSTNGAGLNVLQRVGARVYTRVEGPLSPAMDITQLKVTYANSPLGLFGGRAATVTYELKNAGNVRLTPQVAVKLKDPLGRTVKAAPLKNIAELLPGASVVITEPFTGVPPVGRLTAEVSAHTYGEGAASVTRAQTVWAMPWLLVGLGVVAIAVLVFWLRRRRRRSRPGAAPAAPPATRERVKV